MKYNSRPDGTAELEKSLLLGPYIELRQIGSEDFEWAHHARNGDTLVAFAGYTSVNAALADVVAAFPMPIPTLIRAGASQRPGLVGRFEDQVA